MFSPISRSVRQQASEQAVVIGRKQGSDPNARARLRDRVSTQEDQPTHDEDRDAVEAAAEAVARAIVCVERVQAEYDDAQVSDRALTIARERLIETGLLLETLAHVRPHAREIAALQENARRGKADASDP